MCEIHFIYPINGKIQKYDVNQLSTLLELGAFNNKDGYGVCDDKLVYKSEKKYRGKYKKTLLANFEKSSFLLAHNRFGTSGVVKSRNAHPFYNDRFIWVHNGHIWNYEILECKYGLKHIRVDSQVIGEVLLNMCKSSNSNIVTNIRKMLNELCGSLSVFIYDKVEKRLFYMKHNENFLFRYITNGNRNMIVGDTDSENLMHVYCEKGKMLHGLYRMKYTQIAELVPRDDTIYEITKNGIKKVGTFSIGDWERWETNEDYGYGYISKAYNDYGYMADNQAWTRKDIEEFLRRTFRTEDISVVKIRSGKKKKYRIDCPDYIREVLQTEMWLSVDKPMVWRDLVELAELIVYSDLKLYDYKQYNEEDYYDYNY